jgi:hypothetical protein
MYFCLTSLNFTHIFTFLCAIRGRVEVTDIIMPQPQVNKWLEPEDNSTHPIINPSESTLTPAATNGDQENTVTFLIGFGVLVLFVLGGVMASVFLCVTLKKDPYLWEVVFDGEQAPPEEQQPCQEPEPGDASVLEETASPKPSTSTNDKTLTTDNGGCCSTTPVHSYGMECHRNVDAIL